MKGIAALKDGTPVIEVVHPTRKKAILRASTAKFGWKAITIEALQEEQFKKEVAKDTSKLITEFSKEEQINIAFVPLIFNHIAWIYAMKAVQGSVDNRIEILKKVTRAVRMLRKNYEQEVSKDLDFQHQKHLESETERFISSFQKDFIILYFSVNRELMKKCPDYPYEELRTNAIVSMLMIRHVDKHNKRMDKLVASRLGKSKDSIRMPIMDALYSCMDAFAGKIDDFDFSNHDIQLSMDIIENDIKKIEFSIL